MKLNCKIDWRLCWMLLLLAGSASGGEDLSVFDPAEGNGRKTLREALHEECFAAIDRRLQAYEQIKTAEDLRVWQQQRRETFFRQLGGLPERTPLNAQVVGKLAGDGYRIEKVIFESQPEHHVTANLYLPDVAPPYPAVIVPCGHSYNGKAAEGYQRVSILLARNGIAALCYDPIGQGERYQTFGPDGKPLSAEYEANSNSLRQLDPIPGKPRFNPVEEHTLVGISSILVGRNTATYRIFDGMRAIDYLVSRPDIDKESLGCTGNSGGGTLTAYLMALDERIACAAPACYLTTFRRLIASNGPQDAEQNIFGQIALGLDEADYVLMRAPRPTCLLAGTRDATFDIAGTWEIFREAKRGYARFGYPERIDLVEADAPHGFTTQLRVGAVRCMRRWLLGKDDAVEEPDIEIWSDADLQTTSQGQVMLMPGERSVFDLNRAEEARLKTARQETWSKQSPDALRRLVRETAGIRPLDSIPRLTAETVGTVERQGYRIEKQLLRDEGRLALPALAFTPAKASGDPCLYLHGEGKDADAGPEGPIDKLLREGHFVLAVDLSGIGETAGTSEPSQRRHWSRALFGPDGESFWLAYLLGKSLVGVRTEDVLAAARYLDESQSHSAAKTRLHVIGVGGAGLPALHAAALEPALFESLTLRETTTSWADVVQAPLGNAHLSETIHGALAAYDLPDLVRLIGPQRVRIVEPVRPR
jgi:dienelactone hydrolase